MSAEDVERINLRRWAVEQLAPVTTINTMSDVAQLCRAADALIAYRLTGQYPPAIPGEENGRDTSGSPSESRPN